MNSLRLVLVALVALVGGLGCRGDANSSGNFGPVELNTSPMETATTLQDLRGNASVRHPPDETATFVWSWEADGVDAANTTGIVESSDTKKRELWRVSVFADFGSSTSDTVSAEFEIVNSPPTLVSPIRIEWVVGVCEDARPREDIGKDCNINFDCGGVFTLCAPRASTTLSVAPFTVDDADTDSVTFIYQWFVNGAEVATTTTLGPSFFSEDDTVNVTVTPNDGEEDGPSVTPNTEVTVGPA